MFIIGIVSKYGDFSENIFNYQHKQLSGWKIIHDSFKSNYYLRATMSHPRLADVSFRCIRSELLRNQKLTEVKRRIPLTGDGGGERVRENDIIVT